MTPHHNHATNAAASTRFAVIAFATLLAAFAVVGCSAPTAAMWSGTADIGPIDAFPIIVMLPTEGLAGEVEMKLADGNARFSICSARARNGAIEIEIDWTHRDCKVPEGAAPDRRMLRGSFGAGVMAGVIEQGNRSIGFFRAYRASGA